MVVEAMNRAHHEQVLSPPLEAWSLVVSFWEWLRVRLRLASSAPNGPHENTPTGTLGGLFSGLVLYLSNFYPRHSLQLRLSMMFSVTSLAGAFSGLLAAAIEDMDGLRGLGGWAWIFVLVRYSSSVLYLRETKTDCISGRGLYRPMRNIGLFLAPTRAFEASVADSARESRLC